jgi:hypothetical protein
MKLASTISVRSINLYNPFAVSAEYHVAERQKLIKEALAHQTHH